LSYYVKYPSLIRMTIDEYRLDKNWSYTELARQTGAAHATVARRWCLKFDHVDRLIPSQAFMDRIILLTSGEVLPNDFYIRRQ